MRGERLTVYGVGLPWLAFGGLRAGVSGAGLSFSKQGFSPQMHTDRTRAFGRARFVVLGRIGFIASPGVGCFERLPLGLICGAASFDVRLYGKCPSVMADAS